jgi:hypothetical protein
MHSRAFQAGLSTLQWYNGQNLIDSEVQQLLSNHALVAKCERAVLIASFKFALFDDMASVIMESPGDSRDEDFDSMHDSSDEELYDGELEEEDEELNNAGASSSRGTLGGGGAAQYKIINPEEIQSLINEVSS